MRLALRPVLACAAIAGVRGAQVPLQFARQSGATSDTDMASWNLILSPHPSINSTSHLVFDTVSSLLQHWPNTRYRNGHTIVPGIVPPGTLMYHGKLEPGVPTSPDWVATDPEHSYFFCRTLTNSGCWRYTFAATRPLKVLYFDGTSAAKMRGGPMDSQDVLLWGEVKPDWIFNERKRIGELCEWGKEFELDGYVRMEMDFEIMLCDFTSGVETVSSLYLASPTHQIPLFEEQPNQNPSKTPFLGNITTQEFTAIEAGSRNDHYPGDTRIQLDLSRLVSFYDTSLVPSLVPVRQGKKRHQHRLDGIDRADAAAVMKRLRDALKHDGAAQSRSSGVDWGTSLKVIIARYADRLELVRYLLNIPVQGTSNGRRQNATKAQNMLRVMLTPYILHSAVPPNSTLESGSGTEAAADLLWAAPVFKFCATAHTAYIYSSPILSARLAASERLVLDAMRDTNREICRVIVRMWAEGVVHGLDTSLGQPSTSSTPEAKMDKVLQRWRRDLDELMDWLDWSVWARCDPTCGFEEMCYLPTWPYFMGGWRGPGRPDGERMGRWQDFDKQTRQEEEWELPTPRCIRRIEPYRVW